jgi:hypothetical protein
MSGRMNHANTSFQQMLDGATALTGRIGGSPLQAYQIIDHVLGQQARLRAYVDDFQYMAAVCFLCVPIVLLLRKVIAKKGAVSAAH